MLLRCLFNQWEGWRIAEARRVFGGPENGEPKPANITETQAPKEVTPPNSTEEIAKTEKALKGLLARVTKIESTFSSLEKQTTMPSSTDKPLSKEDQGVQTEMKKLREQAQSLQAECQQALNGIDANTATEVGKLKIKIEDLLTQILEESAVLDPTPPQKESKTTEAPSLSKAPRDQSLDKAIQGYSELQNLLEGKKFNEAFLALPLFLQKRIDSRGASVAQKRLESLRSSLSAPPTDEDGKARFSKDLAWLENNVVDSFREYKNLTDPQQGLRYGAEGAAPNLFDDHFSEAGTVLHNAFFDTAGGMGGKGSYVELVGARLGINPDPLDAQEKNLNAHFAVKVKGLPDSEAITTASSFSEDSISIPLNGKTIEEAVADAMREFVERQDVQKTLKNQFRDHEKTVALKRDADARENAHIDKIAGRRDRKEDRKDESSHPDYKGESREDLVNRILEDHGNPEDYIIRWEEKGDHWIAKRSRERTEEGDAQALARDTARKEFIQKMIGEKKDPKDYRIAWVEGKGTEAGHWEATPKPTEFQKGEPPANLLGQILEKDQVPVGLGPISPEVQQLLVDNHVTIKEEKILNTEQYQTVLVIAGTSSPPFPQGTRLNFTTNENKLNLVATSKEGIQSTYLVESSGLTLVSTTTPPPNQEIPTKKDFNPTPEHPFNAPEKTVVRVPKLSAEITDPSTDTPTSPSKETTVIVTAKQPPEAPVEGESDSDLEAEEAPKDARAKTLDSIRAREVFPNGKPTGTVEFKYYGEGGKSFNVEMSNGNVVISDLTDGSVQTFKIDYPWARNSASGHPLGFYVSNAPLTPPNARGKFDSTSKTPLWYHGSELTNVQRQIPGPCHNKMGMTPQGAYDLVTALISGKPPNLAIRPKLKTDTRSYLGGPDHLNLEKMGDAPPGYTDLGELHITESERAGHIYMRASGTEKEHFIVRVGEKEANIKRVKDKKDETIVVFKLPDGKVGKITITHVGSTQERPETQLALKYRGEKGAKGEETEDEDLDLADWEEGEEESFE